MDKQGKVELVNELHEKLASSQAVFVTDYKGLTVEMMMQLRGSIKNAEGSYQVVKNTLLKRASEGTAATELAPWLEGPTAIAMAHGDPVTLAKALVEFAKKNEKLEIQGGVLGKQTLKAQEVKELATMPSREILLSRMLGSMNAPATNFVGVMAAMIRQLLYALKAIEEQKAQA